MWQQNPAMYYSDDDDVDDDDSDDDGVSSSSNNSNVARPRGVSTLVYLYHYKSKTGFGFSLLQNHCF